MIGTSVKSSARAKDRAKEKVNASELPWVSFGQDELL
jgi:hypothetical protein